MGCINSQQVLESHLDDDMESMQIFVKLTEEERRYRQLRIDLGEADARLKVQTHSGHQKGGTKGGFGGKSWNAGSAPKGHWDSKGKGKDKGKGFGKSSKGKDSGKGKDSSKSKGKGYDKGKGYNKGKANDKGKGKSSGKSTGKSTGK